MSADTLLNSKRESLQARIVSGSVVLLCGSGLTTVINLAYNIFVARFLGPQGFGTATAVYTLLTLLSAVALSFQIVSTKVVAQQTAPEDKALGYRGYHRGAWQCGLLVAFTLVLFQSQIATYLNLSDPFLVAILAVGAAFYIPLGARRGYIQGTYGFLRLAANLVLEGAARLAGSFFLIHLGFGVRGVICANAAAVALAYFASAPKLTPRVPTLVHASYAFRETSQALLFFSGQVLINNCDIVLVKHYFSAQMAGLYAAVAMVGRVIFAFSSAVVNTTFPLVAATRHEERRNPGVIATSLLLVAGCGSALALGLWFAPGWIWTVAFGTGFEIAGSHELPRLLALYALTTVVYSLSVVIITFEMSYKIANSSLVQFGFSVIVIVGICLYHSSLLEVILVQLILMVALFIFVATPFLIDSLTDPKDQMQFGTSRPVRLIRRVTENEVIAEFLRSDFHNPEFQEYRETHRDIVTEPNFGDDGENEKRRALLFVRHLTLWNELPEGTEWYEAELNERDLAQIRLFPRAHWLRLARGDFSITSVTERMRARSRRMDPRFLSKISAISNQLVHDDCEFNALILIGMNENGPMTVLDGNHRLVAAMLASPSGLPKLRFMCGLSPRMTDCCWYNTNLVTLFRYGRNLFLQAMRNSEAEWVRLLQDAL